MSVEINGVEQLLERLDGIANPKKMESALTKACLLIEREAKINAQELSGGDGTLAGSIASKVEGLEGKVYTALFYAPYVEFGTGIEAEGGKGRQDVPWVYVEHSGEERETAQKSYTLETAKRAAAILKSKGLTPHITYGQKPQPFMRPALDNNKDKVTEILKGGLY